MQTLTVRRRGLASLVLGSIIAAVAGQAAGIYVQPPGASYVAYEADGAVTLIAGTPESWVSTNDAAASGGTALYAGGNNSTGDSPHSFAQYSIRFGTAGTYYLYYRWKADPARTAGDAFTANSSWFGTTFGAYSTPADQTVYYRSTSNDATAPADNVYAWRREADTTVYAVSAGQVSAGVPLVFTIGTREAGMVIDRFVFSTEAALTDAQLDALINTDTDIVIQKPSETYAAFEADGVKAKIIAGTPESWVSTNDAAASGGTALYAGGNNSTGDSPHSFAQYSIRFGTAGTYYLYYRWKADPARTAGDAFTANSSWFGTTFGAYSTPADQTVYYRSTSNDATAPADNVYAWRREADTTVYAVSAGQVSAGVPLVFTIGTREAGMVIDRFVFSTEAALSDAQLDALVNSGGTATAPKLEKAIASATGTTVDVTFSRPLAAASVQSHHFVINNGLGVTTASLDAGDPRVVHLVTSAQTPGTVYTLTVNNVTDTSGTAIAPGSTINFTAWRLAAGWALKQVYFNIAGGTVADLANDPRYPDRPDRVEWVKGFQVNDDPLTDNYGARLTTFFTPTASGVYNFYVNNDDEAELLLGSNETEGSLSTIGLFALSPRVFSDAILGTSPAALNAGQRYLLRGLLKQQGAAVYLNVAAKLQSSGTPAASLPVLGGDQIATWVNPDIGQVTFTQQPASLSVTEGHSARFSVKVATTERPVYFQWRVNGTPIAGATRSAYALPATTAADSGKSYDVVVSVAGRDTPSAAATLSVVPGDPPAVQPYLGVNFIGGGTFGGDALSAVDTAGVVLQRNWNNLDGFAFDPAQNPIVLNDAGGVATPITLTATGVGVWYTGARATADADGALLQGFLHWGVPTEPSTITLQGVPAGTYNLLVYSVGFDFSANYYQGYALTGAGTYPVYHGIAERGLDVLNNPAYRRITSTSAASPTGGNYVQFDNVSPATDGSLVLAVTWEPPDPGISNGYQPTVNALQLARVVPVTARPTLGVASGAGAITISWPASAAGYLLKGSPTLGGGATWTTVAGSPNPIAGAGSINVNVVAGGASYYRLEK